STCFFHAYADHPDLHSFPTRRSSDLVTDPTNGCSSVCNITVTQDDEAPNCDAGGPYILNCNNNFSITLDGSSTTPGATYQWKDSEDNDITTDANGDATVTAPGEYTLVVTDPTNGCSSVCNITVTQDDEAPNCDAG